MKQPTAPRQRLCIQCGEPITHGVMVVVPAVHHEPKQSVRWFARYHMSCLPRMLDAAGYAPITLPEAAA